VESRAEPDLLTRALALPALAALLERVGDAPQRIALVGGAVRDLLVGVAMLDADLAVEGPVESLLERVGGEAHTHGRFGTATVRLDGTPVDLARTRRETYAQPGALPDVEPASLEEDLARRDFTVNAMALQLNGLGAGQLIAVPDARADLAQRRLRVLHRRSFIDDPTRLLRLARYRGRLGLEVEEGTRELVGQALDTGALDTVSGARIGHELRLLSAERDPLAGWRALRELGLDEAIAPGLGLTDTAQSVARKALELLPEDGRPEVIVWALALEGVSGQPSGLLDRLAVPSGVRDDAIEVSRRAASVAGGLERADRPSEIAAAVGSPGLPELVALAGARGTGRAEKAARDWLDRLRAIRLEIDGQDLLAAGIAPGPGLGAGLAAARSALLDGRAASRDEQLAEALRAAQAAG
jgi:tRNA nucleotidyltransferase (CCA-adding enzyme)